MLFEQSSKIVLKGWKYALHFEHSGVSARAKPEADVGQHRKPERLMSIGTG
jgi:hypothetical protein